ncbi:SDR family NAD(P)-dependent oxidoreductase [Paraburkholderia sp. SIMBA_050]
MKIFLSIGTGPGMGLATAQRFAREGFRVILSARNVEKTQVFADRLKTVGYEAEARRVDAADLASVAALVRSVEAQYGAIDVLHYNAANIRAATLAEQPLDTFVGDLAVNIGGALAAVQAAMPKMAGRGTGSILLTGGGLSLNPRPGFVSLGIGKAGIRSLALGMFDSCQAQGIHIATVTVAARVAPDSEEARAVGEHFWQLHCQPKDAWTPEVKYSS